MKIFFTPTVPKHIHISDMVGGSAGALIVRWTLVVTMQIVMTFVDP